MLDALDAITTAVPAWHKLLDNLNAQISRRQAELAEVADCRPPTRSLKKNGSTESLRPKDGEADAHPVKGVVIGEGKPPLSKVANSLTNPTTPTKSPEQPAPSLIHSSSNPGPQRQSSRRLTPETAINAAASPKPLTTSKVPVPLRKRKTGSVASNNSTEGLPKYRTRSMIIVYYDSQVQDAFEELVKQISSSRNAMRKGKMAARMAEMRRMAELEAAQEDEDDGDDSYPALPPEPVRTRAAAATNSNESANALTASPVEADDEDAYAMPKLNFVSTRRMGPGPGPIFAAHKVGGTVGGPLAGRTNLPDIRGGLRGGSRHITAPGGAGLTGRGANHNIFDELDAGLEWCQSMCEHAAHQFLRDGDCGIEIDGIKRRLGDVKQTAERELEQLSKKDDDNIKAQTASKGSTPRAVGAIKPLNDHNEDDDADDESLPKTRPSVSKRSRENSSREFKMQQMRRPSGSPVVAKDFLVPDSMEVDDDEGFQDMDVGHTVIPEKRGT